MIIDQSVNMDRKAFNAYASKAHGPDEFTREPYTPEFYKNPISFDHVVCCSFSKGQTNQCLGDRGASLFMCLSSRPY